MVSGNNEIWAADLADVSKFKQYNKGNKFLLLVIDTFNKYGWIVPLKNKTGKTLVKAFKTIFKEGRIPKKLWTDKGREFYNKDMVGLLKRYRIIQHRKRGEKQHCRTMDKNDEGENV